MLAETSGIGIWRGLLRPHGWGATATPHERNTSTNAPWTMVSMTPRGAEPPGPVERSKLFRSAVPGAVERWGPTELGTLGREVALLSLTPGLADRRVLSRSLASGSLPRPGRFVYFNEAPQATCPWAFWAAGMWCCYPSVISQRYQ